MKSNATNSSQGNNNMNQQNTGKMNAEQIKVCIRMRPILPPYEDEDVWGVDYKDNKIFSLNNNLGSTLDPMTIAMGQMGNGQQMNINTFIREKEIRRRYQDAMQTQAFQFDNVFGQDIKTPQIYHTIVRPITKSALQGYNGTVFMYGQTTSGKTYTMLGSQEIPGILPCAVRDVFNGIKNDRENNEYNVWVSYMEIYNESINDLLAPGKGNLKIKDDPNHGVDVALLKKQQVFTFDQAIILMNYGEEHRIYKETSIHEHSSRSHTIFRLYIESCPKNKSGPKKYSMLNLVDLAGSERLNEFDCKSDTVGETGFINKSLFVLSNVINKLAEGKSGHIPYRDSKLTRILQMALGGNSLTAIICTISPAAVNYYQSLSTLRFALRAKTVKNKPILNEIIDETEMLAMKFQVEIDKLKEEITQKDTQIVQFQEQQQQLQRTIYHEKEQKEILNQQINDIKNNINESDVKDQEIERLREKLKKAKLDKQQLKNELKQVKVQSNSEVNQTEAIGNNKLVENLIEAIEGSIVDLYQSGTMEEYFSQISQEKVDISNNQHWVMETEKMKAQYKLELLTLQNKYRKYLQQSLTEVYSDEAEYFIVDYINQNILKQVDPESRETASQFANAAKVLQDIEDFAVFDDIVIEYDKVADRGFENLGYNLNQIKRNLIIPNVDDYEKVVGDLKEYYYELVNVAQRRYEEVKVILETFFRQQIAIKREELDAKHVNDEISEEDFQAEASTFAQIAGQHNDKLTKLRDGFDQFSNLIDQNFDFHMQKLSSMAGNGCESSDAEYQQQLQSNQKQSDSEKISYQKRGRREVDDAYSPLYQNQDMMNVTTKQHHDEQFIDKLASDNYNRPTDTHQISMQEEPPEVRSSTYTHNMVTPTPKFSNSNKFRPQSNQSVYNKENSYGAVGGKLPMAAEIQSQQQALLPKLRLKQYSTTQNYNSNTSSSQGFKVYVWGSGKDGRCGNGKETNERVPNQIASSYKFTQMSSGYHHSAAVSQDGMILTWGRGIFGQLGHGDTENYSLPTPIESLVRIQVMQVACGWQHTMALSSQGRIFSWGYGEDGQLGQGDTNDYLLPKEIDFFKKHNLKSVFIACGHSHSGCITDSSPAQVFLWGCNPDSRLMIEENENRLTPSLTLLENLKHHNKDRIEAYEPYYLSLGVTHSAIITRNGELFTGGSKLDGQLGIKLPKSISQMSSMMNTQTSNMENSFLNQYRDSKELKELSSPFNRVSTFGPQNKALQVSCGDSFTLVLNERNEIYSFGKLSHGRLGLGPQASHQTDSNLRLGDTNQSEQVDCIQEPKLISALKNEKIVQISAGCRHAACVTENGKLYTWGFNFYEQLGLGDCEKDFDVPTRVNKNLAAQKVRFVSCGYFHTGALVQISN